MDVYLKKRWDLIPNIVETVKGYAKHEKDTLKEVVELRNSAYDKMSDDEKIKTNEQLSNGISKIMALAEAYPDLNVKDYYTISDMLFLTGDKFIFIFVLVFCIYKQLFINIGFFRICLCILVIEYVFNFYSDSVNF